MANAAAFLLEGFDRSVPSVEGVAAARTLIPREMYARTDASLPGALDDGRTESGLLDWFAYDVVGL